MILFARVLLCFRFKEVVDLLCTHSPEAVIDQDPIGQAEACVNEQGIDGEVPGNVPPFRIATRAAHVMVKRRVHDLVRQGSGQSRRVQGFNKFRVIEKRYSIRGHCGNPFGMPTSPINELYVNSDGTAVYDPETNRTWLANANLAATWLPVSNLGEFDTLGLPLCETAPDTTPCAAQDGSMDFASAKQFIKNMNAYDNGPDNPRGYLGRHDWGFPNLVADVAECPTYGCSGSDNPMGNLYYKQLAYDGQLGFPAGTPVVPVPDIAVGPFIHLVPFPYWSCLADTIQEPCQSADSESPLNEPSKNSEWGFSFGTGFLGTERLTANHFVTAYYMVTVPPTKPPIPPKCPPTDPSRYQ